MKTLRNSAILLCLLVLNPAHADTKRYNVELRFVDDTVFRGSFDYNPETQQISNLQGLLDDTLMYWIEELKYQLEAKPDGKGGITAYAYSMNTQEIETDPEINNNAYVAINFNATDPTLGATDESQLEYMDCSEGGLMGRTCMYYLPNHDPLYPMEGGQGILSQTITLADQEISHSDCLFDWAENNFSDLFSPIQGVAASKNLPPYYFRHYADTNAYLGISSARNNAPDHNHVYYLASDGSLLDVGHSYEWLQQANCLYVQTVIID